MNPISDPMGEALEAYINGNSKATIKVISNITEDDIISVGYLFRSFDQMPELEQQALKFCKGRVLDIGAGAGSHALWLQENGLEVDAFDISPKAVAVMKNRGLRNSFEADFWQFQPSEKYDTILLLMNGVGLAGTLEKLPEFLNLLKSWLNPGGQILLESSDILYMFEEEDGSVLLNLNSGYYGEVEYQMAFNRKTGPAFPWLFIDYALLHDYATQAGFEVNSLFEGEHGEYLAKLSA
ncbi:class I SAM-dependent methyltransferase [Adhaeribacter soli]|uniref:Class I SAM-dependent methyltransferase n=1 Tax=Adhaeribacter soli TaxID=2607655 RepID=A0A5N1J553_9BACT|nr:class I SAM-dependent methyltransferase [Adhaeribacter soli]KAA9345820.1 class I SAM-dependent methyltransferase [Adhaeribacter soli]